MQYIIMIAQIKVILYLYRNFRHYSAIIRRWNTGIKIYRQL